MNGTEERVGEEGVEKRLRSQAHWIYVESGIAALILTVLSFFFASALPEAARSSRNLSLEQAGDFLVRHGYAVLFGWVLLEQMGLPIPAAPLLIAAGALPRAGKMNLTFAVALAWIGVILADLLWFSLGRYRGGRMLALPPRSHAARAVPNCSRARLMRSANSESFRPAWRPFFARGEICTRPEYRGAASSVNFSHARATFRDLRFPGRILLGRHRHKLGL